MIQFTGAIEYPVEYRLMAEFLNKMADGIEKLRAEQLNTVRSANAAEPAAGTATATDSSPVVEQPAAVSLSDAVDVVAAAVATVVKNKGGRPRKNRDTAPVSEAPAEAAEVSASQPAVENTGSEQGGLEPSPPVPALTQTTVAEAAVVAPISDAEINSLGKAVYDLIGMPAFIELRKEFGVADKKMKEIPQEVRPALMAKMRAVQKAELAKQAVG